MEKYEKLDVNDARLLATAKCETLLRAIANEDFSGLMRVDADWVSGLCDEIAALMAKHERLMNGEGT